MQDRNISAVAVGRKQRRGAPTDELAVTIFVIRKIAADLLPPARRLPPKLDVHGELVDTDVVEAGPFHLHTNATRIRPAQPGTSIGEVSITAGTLGAVVIKDGKEMILSNNHVLANNNRAHPGSVIVQPGPADDGHALKDAIAILDSFVPIHEREANLVDAALAVPLRPRDVLNNPLNGVPAPSETNPAVGLIFAGDGVSHTFMNPIDAVLSALGANLPQRCTTAAEIDMPLEKTGRTSDRTEGMVTHLHAMTRILVDGIGDVQFTDQIMTTPMSLPGDSGSVAVLSTAR